MAAPLSTVTVGPSELCVYMEGSIHAINCRKHAFRLEIREYQAKKCRQV
jgi:hypothetical protein